MDPTTNDQLDRQRIYSLFTGFVSNALGVDPGPTAYDGSLTNLPGQHSVLNISTGTATQGQAASVSANLAGVQLTLPMILVVAVGGWYLLKHHG